MTGLGVIGTIAAHRRHGFSRRDLRQQLRQHRRVADAVVRDLDGPDLQRLGINAQMHLAPLPAVFRAMLLRFPLTFTQHLHAGAVDQQMQPIATGAIGNVHGQRLLAAADGAVVGHGPSQTRQMHQALHEADGLAQRQTEQALDGQAELDGGIAERR